jgi:NADH-quinone oxidoreductase subunit L
MKGPLVALAIPSLLIGFFTVGPWLFGGFFEGAIHVRPEHDVLEAVREEFHGPIAFAFHGFLTVPFFLAAAGVATAWYFVLRNPAAATAVSRAFAPLVKVFENKYYFDWFNENVIARTSRGVGSLLWGVGDRAVIDGAVVNGSAKLVGAIAGLARRVQTGFLYSYAFWMVIGLALLLVWSLRNLLPVELILGAGP